MLRIVSLLIALVAFSAVTAHAAGRPVSLQLQAYEHTPEGEKLALYGVQCSDRSEPVISKTVGEQSWCVNGSQCFSRKIQAAQQACASSVENAQRLADRGAGEQARYR